MGNATARAGVPHPVRRSALRAGRFPRPCVPTTSANGNPVKNKVTSLPCHNMALTLGASKGLHSTHLAPLPQSDGSPTKHSGTVLSLIRGKKRQRIRYFFKVKPTK